MNFNERENRFNDLELEKSINRSEKSDSSLQKELIFSHEFENAIPSGIAVIDETGKQVYINRSFCRMVGWEKEELLGINAPFVYWDKRDIENIKNAFRQTMDNNSGNGGYDLLFSHKSGRSIPVNVTIAPIKLENNKTYFLANIIDISKRKKTEEDLLKSQSLLAASIEGQKNTIIFFVDRNYNYLYFNKAHVDSMKYAYNVDIEPGMNMVECMSIPDDKKAAIENFDRAFSGESHSYINTFGTVNRDYYEIFFNPILNEKKEIIGATGFARNISERIHADHALKDSETKFKEIINQINDVIIVFDEKEKIIIWNRGAENFTGIKASDAVNANIVDIQYRLSPEKLKDRELIEKQINGIIKFESPDTFNQIIDSEVITLNSKSIRNVQSMVFPIKLNGSHLYCVVLRDTTEIKRYEKELLRISADKDKFYSIIAQYLYTPFNVFNNFSKLMAEELDNLPIREIQKMAAMMSKSANNLYTLLDNMLQWTRMNQGKIAFEPQKLILKKVCQDAVSVIRPDADAKNIRINHLIPDEIHVFADNYMVKTIIRNLVSNAIKFTGEGGHIDISAQQTHSDIVISVFDNGIGITPAYLSKLFDTSQIQSTLGAAEEKGTTLGLLLCKEYVEKHGGKIWVESKDGKGSEFKLTLPVS